MNGQHLACEALTRMYVILTRSGLLFIYKMIPEIISKPREDSGYPHNFMVNSSVFKGDESESKGKTDNGPGVCPLLVKGLPLCMCRTCTMSTLGTLCKYTHTHTHTHTHTSTRTRSVASQSPSVPTAGSHPPYVTQRDSSFRLSCLGIPTDSPT